MTWVAKRLMVDASRAGCQDITILVNMQR